MTRAMKDSGVEWIGEIPENWETVRTKNVATLSNGNSIKDDEKSQYEDSTDAIPYISTKDIDSLHNIDYCNGMYVKNDDSNFKVAHKNSILMCIEGGSAGIKKAKLKQDVCFVNKLCCFEPKSVDSDYLYYFLNSPKYEDHFKSLMSGLIGGVSISDLKNINCTLPPLSEQQKIADFLDEKCGAIDEIISKTEQSIEEYKKLKQSVITEAVTKGVRPNRPMQDSNIEWIGKIPEDWNVRKTLHCLSMPITDGPHTTPQFFEDGIPFISAESVSFGKGKIDLSHARGYISDEFYKECCLKYVPKINDLLMIKSGATTGKVSIVDIEKKFTIWSPLAVFRVNPSMLFYKFLFYFIQSQNYQRQLEDNWSFGTQQNIGMRVLEQLKIVLPPLDEQKEIADYLDEKCAEIDTLIEKKQQFLSEMANYRKSLIYEYVTGKKEVA